MDIFEINEDIWNNALICFDGDQDKAIALLKLFKYIPNVEVKMPDVTMVLPEDNNKPCSN